MKYIYLILFAVLGISCLAYPQEPAVNTIVYIVRHAEKDVSNPGNPDPQLSVEGRERAKALAGALEDEKFAVIFSTKYKRTIQTGEPVAKNAGLAIEYYNPANPRALAELIKTTYNGKKALIIGHSNTVLELVEAFDVARPLSSLTDDDYDFVFKIDINQAGHASLVTRSYGKPHHSSVIKK
jgi:phosphohistidine phosphatase SixA